jgi:hypothetical protein
MSPFEFVEFVLMLRALCWLLLVAGASLLLKQTAVAQVGTADIDKPTIRFLVGERGALIRHESYVLPLAEDADIAHARDLIARGPDVAGRPIVVARIAAGANGINRNYHAAGSPPWSWHVTGLSGFADVAAEVLDGWPGAVEANLDYWTQTVKAIGFYRWTVVAELPTGDYDADLDVDGGDFTAWRTGFGGTIDLTADGSANCVVDAADYVLWRNNLGASITLPPPPHGTTVGVAPEPKAVSFILVAMPGLWLRRRFYR